MIARHQLDDIVDAYSVTDLEDGPKTKKAWLAIDRLLADAVDALTMAETERGREIIQRARKLGYGPEDK